MVSPEFRIRTRRQVSRLAQVMPGSSPSLRRALARMRSTLLAGRPPAPPFFQTLHALLAQEGDVSLDELMATAGEQTYGLLILVSGLISFIPGVSMAGGLVALILGLQMARGVPRPWLPRRLASLHLHRGRVKEGLARFEGWLARLGRRGDSGQPLNQRWMGVMALWTAFLTALPVPPIIPMGNAIPAATLCLLGAALLEERPAWAWIGALGMLGTTLYLGLSARLLWAGLVRLMA